MNPGDSKTHCECLEPYGVYKACVEISFWHFQHLAHFDWLLHIIALDKCCEIIFLLYVHAVNLICSGEIGWHHKQYWPKPTNLPLQFIAAIFPICYYQF